jgi:hypothetical protein
LVVKGGKNVNGAGILKVLFDRPRHNGEVVRSASRP